MLFDILAVFVVTLISPLFLCNTSVHGFPKSSSNLEYIRSHPTADLSSSLRLFNHHPVPSVDYDLGGDISEMLIGESNELLSTNDHDDDASSLDTSADAFNESFDFDYHRSPSKSLSSKLFLSLKKQHQQNQEEQESEQKRSISPSINASPVLPSQFNLKSAVTTAGFVDPSHTNNVINFSQLSESTRLSPSLKVLVETNPFARAWLTMLLQKVMEEQPVPYIFKYGRRRRK